MRLLGVLIDNLSQDFFRNSEKCLKLHTTKCETKLSETETVV